MNSIKPERETIDYSPCRYEGSRTLFRGPKPELNRPYISFYGGTETYGKFIPTPYPTIVGKTLGMPCVNLGVANAGPDFYLNEPAITHLGNKALATVIQIPSLQNITNQFFSVHPRRNDRFIQASPLLKSLLQHTDLSEVHFTGHLMRLLQTLPAAQLATVVDDLRQTWLERMTKLITSINGPAILLWFAKEDCPSSPTQDDPFAVTRGMIALLRPLVRNVVFAASHPAPALKGICTTTHGMVFSPLDASIAEKHISLLGHEMAAAALVPCLTKIMPASRVSALQETDA